jgi:hypothetical protein
MSLASDRQSGRLICTCPHPDPRPIALFDAIIIRDVRECSHCGRKVVTTAATTPTPVLLGSEVR